MNKDLKKYVKPQIMFVDFTLSSSIAGTCKYEANSVENACGYDDNGYMVYNSSLGCDIQVDTDLCYHVPSADTSIFAS